MAKIKKIIHKHPLAIRWFHWLNFPILAVMIWSGLLIYWANGIYKLGWGDQTVLKFFPKSFYEALNVPFRLAEGMSFHFLFMWVFAINGLLYVAFLFFSGEWRYLFPERKTWKEAGIVFLNSLLFRKSKAHQGKYNPAQRVAYSIVLFMGLLMLLTGLAIYKPVQLNWLCWAFGGYANARAGHFIFTILFCLFFLVHVVQVIIAGWNTFQAMITGIEVLPEDNNKNESSSLYP